MIRCEYCFVGGGAIFWMHSSGMVEPSGLDMVNFTENTALYGTTLATEKIHLQVNTLYKEGNNNRSTTIDIQDVTVFQQAYQLFVVAKDAYDQRVLSNSDDYIKVGLSSTHSFSCSGNLPTASGSIMVQLAAGVADFSNLFVTCAPGGNMTIVFKDVVSSSTVSSNAIALRFRTCIVGEYYRDGECRACEVGFYSKKSNEDLSVTECERCPFSAASCNSSFIVMRPGYWAISTDSEDILKCPMGANACPGGIPRVGYSLSSSTSSISLSTTSFWEEQSILDINEASADSASVVAGCREGYIGKLCAVCAEDYFYHPSSNTCAACDGGNAHGTAIALLVIFMLFPICLLTKTIVDRRQGKSAFSQMWDEEGFTTAVVCHCHVLWMRKLERK